MVYWKEEVKTRTPNQKYCTYNSAVCLRNVVLNLGFHFVQSEITAIKRFRSLTLSSLRSLGDLTGLKGLLRLAGFFKLILRKNSRAFRNFSSSDFVEGKITTPRALRVV